MAEFEGKERRMPKIEVCLAENGIASLEEAREICKNAGVDVEALVKGVQPIAFENAVWAYTLGAAIGIKRKVKSAADAARCIGEGLQAFCIPGSVAEQRRVGLGHGNLGAMLLSEETKCFAFLAGHESFAAAFFDAVVFCSKFVKFLFQIGCHFVDMRQKIQFFKLLEHCVYRCAGQGISAVGGAVISRNQGGFGYFFVQDESAYGYAAAEGFG